MEPIALRSRFATDKEHAVTLARFGGNGVVAWQLHSIDDFDGMRGPSSSARSAILPLLATIVFVCSACRALWRRRVGAIVQMKDCCRHSPGAGKKPDQPRDELAAGASTATSNLSMLETNPCVSSTMICATKTESEGPCEPDRRRRMPTPEASTRGRRRAPSAKSCLSPQLGEALEGR